jgi:hypothetical protein
MMHHMPLARSVKRVSIKVDIVFKPFLQEGRIKIKANAQPPLFSYENKYGSGYDFSYPKINSTAPVVIEQEYVCPMPGNGIFSNKFMMQAMRSHHQRHVMPNAMYPVYDKCPSQKVGHTLKN